MTKLTESRVPLTPLNSAWNHRRAVIRRRSHWQAPTPTPSQRITSTTWILQSPVAAVGLASHCQPKPLQEVRSDQNRNSCLSFL